MMKTKGVTCRVYALDCLGFGWSSKPLVDYKGYNLWEEQIAGKGQCDLLLGLTAGMGGKDSGACYKV